MTAYLLAPGVFHSYGGGGGDLAGYVLHLVIASAVWHVVARLPLPVMVGAGVLAFVLLRRRRRSRVRA